MARPVLDSDASFNFPVDGSGNPTTGTSVDSTKDVSRFRDKHCQVNLAGTWDIDIEGTVDGSNYVTIQAGLVAGNTMIVIAPWYKKMRINTNTAGASGDFSVYLGGFTVGDWE